MAIIPSAESKHNDVEISANAPISETLLNKVGANINSLIDDNDTQDTAIGLNTTFRTNNTDLIDFVSGSVTASGTLYTVPVSRKFIGIVRMEHTTTFPGGGVAIVSYKKSGTPTPVPLVNGNSATSAPHLSNGVTVGTGSPEKVFSAFTVYLEAGDSLEVIISGAPTGATTAFFSGHEVKEQV